MTKSQLVQILLRQPRKEGMGEVNPKEIDRLNAQGNTQAQQRKASAGLDVALPSSLPSTFSKSAALSRVPVIPLLVFTFNRPSNLQQTLESLLRHRPLDTSRHPIFISQDGTDEPTRQMAMRYVTNEQGDARWKDIHYLQHHWETSGVQVEAQHYQWTTYYKIATHYGWALRQVLDGGVQALDPPGSKGNGWQFDHVILIEDDMEIAPDFYEYFQRTRQIFDADPTLLCVSAWNDNGRRPLVGRSSQLYRSDCFPGLGWLLNRRVWNEMRDKWPKGFWDDWLREPQQRQGRSCIFPEINRVFTFGEKGSSASANTHAHASRSECDHQRPPTD